LVDIHPRTPDPNFRRRISNDSLQSPALQGVDCRPQGTRLIMQRAAG